MKEKLSQFHSGTWNSSLTVAMGLVDLVDTLDTLLILDTLGTLDTLDTPETLDTLDKCDKCDTILQDLIPFISTLFLRDMSES
jgi:hypothetical protein